MRTSRLVWLMAVCVFAGYSGVVDAEQASTQPKAEGAKAEKRKNVAAKAADAGAAQPGKGGGKSNPLDAIMKKGKDKATATGPIKVSLPIWCEKGGFGLPVPPDWTGKVEGNKVKLVSPGPEADQTTITMGPEPSDLDAIEYLGALQKELAEKEKLLTIPAPPIDVMERTIYACGYLDTRVSPQGFGGILVMDRPAGQVFVIKIFTHDQNIMTNYSVLGCLAMIRFKGEPAPDITQISKIGKSKPRPPLDQVAFKKGEAARSEMRLSRVLREIGKKTGVNGAFTRYLMAIATPKSYTLEKSWPILFVEGPADEQGVSRYQGLADDKGIIVVALQPQAKDQVWSVEAYTAICFSAVNSISRQMAIDRTRVYLLASGGNSKLVQAVAAGLPVARGVVVHESKEDGLSGVVGQKEEAKSRLAVALASVATSKQLPEAQARGLAEALKKAGLTTQVVAGKDDRGAVRDAVGWLLDRDAALVEAEASKLIAKAESLAKEQPGEALTLCRRIMGGGAKGAAVEQASKIYKRAHEEFDQTIKNVTTQGTDSDPSRVADQFQVALRYLGSPEGSYLLQSLAGSLRSQ